MRQNKKTYKRHSLAVLTVACLLSATSAHAQTTPQVPSTADPSRVIPQAPQAAPDPSLARQPLEISSPIDEVVIEGAEKVIVPLKEILFDGITVFPMSELRAQAGRLEGRDVTLKQIVDLLNDINRRYRINGYIAARAFFPEQDITDGIVHINVVEGHIGNIRVENPLHAESKAVKTQLRNIKGDKPFNIYEFERSILTLNHLAGASFKSILKPTENENDPGALDIVLVESGLDANVTVSFDNYGSAYAGPYQLTLASSQNHILTPYDTFGVQVFSSAEDDEVLFGMLRYAKPSASVPGLQYSMSASAGKTKAGDSLEPLDIKGYVQEAAFGLSYYMPFSRQENLTLGLDFSAKNATSKILGEELYEDKIRSLRVSAQYQGTDSWNGINSLYGQVSQGLNILGARPEGSENLSRADGESDFTKFNAQYVRLQNLPANFQLYGHASGQYSLNPLLSSEEFGFGGGSMGRGYDPSEITGDDGISASIEARYNFIPEYSQIQLVQPYLFFDIGKVWQKDDVEPKGISAASAGFGARVYHKENFTLNLTIAFPMTLSPGNPPPYTNEDGARVLFSLTKTF